MEDYEMSNEQFWELLRTEKLELLNDLIDELKAIGTDDRTLEVLKAKKKELSQATKQH